MIELRDGRATITFDRYDLDAYRVFLRCKQLPERELAYDWEADTYTLTTHERFVGLLDETLVAAVTAGVPLADHLFDYQQFIVGQAITARRYAIWADTGLGKTAMFLEWGRQVAHRTAGRVLILAPTHELIGQHCEEWKRFYGDSGLRPLEQGRQTVGFELKESYHAQAVRNAQLALERDPEGQISILDAIAEIESVA